jgi:hypothetical protein
MTLKSKTLFCVAAAGFLFIPAVFFDFKYLIIAGAFFDWLPLFTKWMKFKDFPINKLGLTMHIVLTTIAYIFAVLWFFIPIHLLGFLFLEIWFSAVISGDFIYSER